MMVCYDYEEIDVTTSEAKSLTAAKVAAMGNAKGSVVVMVTAYPVAYRQDGGTPTTSTYQQLAVSDAASPKTLIIEGRINASQFKCIGVGGTAKLAASYFRRQ